MILNEMEGEGRCGGCERWSVRSQSDREISWTSFIQPSICERKWLPVLPVCVPVNTEGAAMSSLSAQVSLPPPPPPLHPPVSLWSAKAKAPISSRSLVSLVSLFHTLFPRRDICSSFHQRSCVHSSAVMLCLLVYFF